LDPAQCYSTDCSNRQRPALVRTELGHDRPPPSCSPHRTPPCLLHAPRMQHSHHMRRPASSSMPSLSATSLSEMAKPFVFPTVPTPLLPCSHRHRARSSLRSHLLLRRGIGAAGRAPPRARTGTAPPRRPSLKPVPSALFPPRVPHRRRASSINLSPGRHITEHRCHPTVLHDPANRTKDRRPTSFTGVPLPLRFIVVDNNGEFLSIPFPTPNYFPARWSRSSR
jgi:hypothetical protein